MYEEESGPPGYMGSPFKELPQSSPSTKHTSNTDKSPDPISPQTAMSPDEESDEDENLEGLDVITGYEHTGFGKLSNAEPPPNNAQPEGKAPPQTFNDLNMLSEEDCRQSLLAFVAQHCCYGKACATDMDITEILPSTALHYTLETFSESRSSCYIGRPYSGGPVDGPENGTAPPPWSIPCTPDELFKEHTQKIDVPHTSIIRMCHKCKSKGWKPCKRCGADGKIRCLRCGGDGKIQRQKGNDTCAKCKGKGQRRCNKCDGTGKCTCGKCKGYRQLHVCIQLIISFVNHISEYIKEETDMPDELVKYVQGVTVFEQALPQLWPITSYPDEEINKNSERLIEEHNVSFTMELIRHQRHSLRAVPVTEVHYQWKNHKSRFWLYGLDRKVYAPDYPQTCCCVIL